MGGGGSVRVIPAATGDVTINNPSILIVMYAKCQAAPIEDGRDDLPPCPDLFVLVFLLVSLE